MKHYIIDTNILITDPNAITNLLDNGTNKVTIPINVLTELDKLKNDIKVGYLARNAINELIKLKDSDKVSILGSESDEWINNYLESPDGKILNNILKGKFNAKDENIFLTNDNLFSITSEQIFAKKKAKIKVESYNTKGEYISDPVLFNGFLKSSNVEDNFINVANYFTWNEGKLHFNNKKKSRPVVEQKVWTLSPRHYTQKMMIDLILNDDISLLSVQGQAGFGKSVLALACALYETFEKHKYKKIVFVKPMFEIGNSMGFLPGDVNDKISSYFEYALELLLFLSDQRKATKIFNDPQNYKKIDEKAFKFMPLNFIRGMNLNDTLLICDEFQNANKHELKSILTRCGEGTKAIILGDVNQIDNPAVNKQNNAISHLVRNLLPNDKYAHIVLSGKQSRGPVCDMILNSEI